MASITVYIKDQIDALLGRKADLVGSTLDPAQVPDLSTGYVATSGDQTVGGAKTFTDPVTAPVRDKGGQVFNVLAYGALGDGTDDTAAINAALTAAKNAGGGIVYFPYTRAGYGCAAMLVLASGVVLRGERRVQLKRVTTSSPFFIYFPTNCDGAGLEGLTIDAAGLVTSACVDVAGPNTTRTTIRDNRFIGSAPLNTSVMALQIMGGTSRTKVLYNDFENLMDNIKVYGDAAKVTICNNYWTGWGNRAIYAVGTATLATADLWILGNTIENVNTSAGSPRQPIAVQGATGARHQRVKIIGNALTGNGLAHHQGNDGGTLLGGTADQISVQHCEDFVIAGNHSYNGGEVGITVAVDCRHGAVTGNVCSFNNTCGVALDGSGGDVTDVAVTGNMFANNGKELAPPAGGARVGVKAAVYCLTTHGVTVDGNLVVDDQATHTQLYLLYANGSDTIAVGTNAQRNLTAQLDPASTGFTGTMTSTVALA